MMKKIIQIDEDTRIVIDSQNYALQYKRRSEINISYRTEGYFPDVESLADYHIKSSLLRADEAIKTKEKLIEVVKRSTDQIS